MFKPLAIYIGLRYTRAKRRNQFISFISLASMLGIALGVMVLITVMSVMNGFDDQIKNRIFTMVPQVTIMGGDGMIDWQRTAQEIKQQSQVVAAAPFISSQAMASYSGDVAGVIVTGVLPQEEKNVSFIQDKMIAGKMSSLKPRAFNVVLGADLAARLRITIGDKITVVTPQASISPFGIEPVYKRFNVSGIFRVGGGFQYDSTALYIHLSDAQKLLRLGNKVSGLRVKVSDLYAAPSIASEFNQNLSGQYYATDWTQEYGEYFKAIRMEKTMIFVLLLFIIAVAAFNLVSTLVMAVNDKRSDIAILRTLGASQKTIMGIFIVQGSIVGTVGTFLGIISGTLLALNISHLVRSFEHYFHTQFISASVYFIDYLPSKLMIADVVHIGLAALIMSLLATIYPAWRAAQTRPVEALRYE